MSIIDTLITDRTLADVERVKALRKKGFAAMTSEERSEFLAPMKGAYNATDLNRVQEAMEYLAERFRGYGYNVPEIKRPSITEVIPGTSELPEGYTELEYIQSTGTEYVDTGLKPNQDSRAVADVQFMSFPSGHSAIFGSYDSVNQWWAYYRYDQSQYRAVNGGTTQKSVAYADPTLRATLDLQNGLYRVNDTEVTWSQDEFSIDSSVYLFALNRQGGSMQYPASCRMYSCKIYDNGTLVRDYVPCLNPSNEVGLYDIVNGVFYGNAGSGEFIAGYLPTIDKNTLLLLHGEAIEDASPNAAAITNSGVTVSAEQSVFGGSSLYFNGSSRLDINIADIGLDLNGDWTIDFWKYATANASKSAYVCMPNSERGFVLGSPSNGYDRIFAGDTGGDWTFIPVSDIGVATINAWEHIAVVKKDATIYAFENGVLYATIATSGTITMTNVLTIGYRSTTTNTGGFTGYLDELRISNVACWTSDFTPPDVAYYADETNIPSQTIVRDYWKIGDIPRKEQMELYLTNLGYVKNVLGLLKSTPESPSTMEYLSYVEANNIEQILEDIEFVITHTIQSMARLNAFMFVSGYRPFPSSASDYGRTWDDIDDLELNWDDLDDGEAWYTMQYGVIK